jgi:putative ABC transport system permease protein
MLRHNLILIYRNFKRFRSTFLINLTGLSTGLACALLIWLWVHDEVGMDKFHDKDNRLFQVMEHMHYAEGIATSGATPGMLAEALENEMSQVEYAVSTADLAQYTLTVNGKNVKGTGQYTGNDFFNVFSYDLVQGNESDVLAGKNSIVISEGLARKLFGSTENLIGRTVEFQHRQEFIISGIFKDVPPNASTKFEFVLPYEAYKAENPWVTNWGNTAPQTYVVLKEGADVDAFNRHIAGFIQSKDKNLKVTISVSRYSDGYLYGKYENGVQAGGRVVYVTLFSIIAFFILGIACINFMNLSTAKASGRIKEVGIKKAIGAHRRILIFQYMGESLFMCFLSLAVAVLMVDLFLEPFNRITGKHLVLHFDADVVLSFTGITLLTGLIAGSYPALYLSGFSPAAVLKGKRNSAAGELWARKGLVVFQFSLSIILIVAVLVVYKQITLVQTKNLGYNKDNIIYFQREGQLDKTLSTFLTSVKNVPGVVEASSTSNTMIGRNSWTSGLRWEGKNPDEVVQFEVVRVNYNMIELMGIEMKEGRTFSSDFSTDSAAVIFNEAAINVMGLKDPLGKVVSGAQIIGVAKNFHFESLHEEVKPLLFVLSPTHSNKVMIRIEAGKERETIARLEEFYQRYNPGFSFDYKFLDENYQGLYAAEKRVALLSRYFAGLAVLISCLGLFGLAAFTAERRLKEIGIRKVLGSSVFGIVSLLSRDFTKIVLAAIAIALPVSYFIAKHWLDGFAYKVALEWWYFAGAGLTALVIAWLTVGSQAIRAARVNPTQCLKDE